jgi:hypothetical protein
MYSGADTFIVITRNPKPEIRAETRSLPASKFQLSKVGFPIRKCPDQSLFAAPRTLSQRTTSFIASYRQGIHQMLLGHLIALISNAHPEKVLLAQVSLGFGRALPERPEVIEIYPGRNCGRNSLGQYTMRHPSELSSEPALHGSGRRC